MKKVISGTVGFISIVCVLALSSYFGTFIYYSIHGSTLNEAREETFQTFASYIKTNIDMCSGDVVVTVDGQKINLTCKTK